MVLYARREPGAGAGVFRSMPIDAGVDLLRKAYSVAPKRENGESEWGDRVAWEELLRKDPYPLWLD